VSIFSGVVGKVVEAASGAFQARTKRKSRQEEFANAVHLQKLENVKLGKIAEAEWNNNSIKKAGWRPGFLTILLSIPLVLVFIPPMVVYVESGFLALESTPEWYRALIGVMVASAFGVKKLSDYFMDKKYTLSDKSE